MFVAASAGLLGGLAAVAGSAVAVGQSSSQPEKGKPGAHAPWPYHSASTPFVNAADFGLKPCFPDKLKIEDFAHNPDASEALQRALDAGARGQVFLPPGVYRVTRPLTLESGTTISGAGYCSSILMTEKAIPAIIHAHVGGPMTIIRDLWVAGPVGGNRSAAGIWLDQANGVTIHDCWISALGTGVRVDGISDTWLRNVVFELNQFGVTVTCAELSPTAGNLRLLDCYGYQNYQAGMTLTNCRGVQVQACSATGSTYALLAKGCAQMTIQGTQVTHDGSPWHRFGVRLEDCEHLTFSGNMIEGMIDYGLAMVGCRHFTATGNVVRRTIAGPALLAERCEAGTIGANNLNESAKDGLTISNSRRLVITGNVIDSFGRGNEKPGTWRGLRIDKDCTDCLETANLVAAAS
jgi:hypothetical protein